eukprot:gene20153-22127_t
MTSLVSYDSSSEENNSDELESELKDKDTEIQRETIDNKRCFDLGHDVSEESGTLHSEDNELNSEDYTPRNSLVKCDFLSQARERFKDLREKREDMMKKGEQKTKCRRRKRKRAMDADKRKSLDEGDLKNRCKVNANSDICSAKIRPGSAVDLIKGVPAQDFKIFNEYDPHGRKKSRIEKDLDEAIKEGNFSLAEKISDEIRDRDIAVQITDGIKAKQYLERQKIIEETKKRKKKKLQWSFEQKQRWEVKGNM